MQEPQQSRFFDLSRVALPLCAAIGLLAILMPDLLSRFATSVTQTVHGSLDWFLLLVVTSFLVFLVWIALSRYGEVKLGEDDDVPEFSFSSWIAMLFTAGMGVGLLFWGAAEPVIHFDQPPLADNARSSAAASQAMVHSLFHWGLHAWSIYGVTALVIAYFAFRRQEPLLPGTPLRHVFLGRWVEPVAWSADLVAILTAVFAMVGALGMGAFQLQSGLHEAFGTSAESLLLAGGVLVVLIGASVGSAASPLHRGIRWLSNFNLLLALLLLAFVLSVGETSFLLRTFISSAGDYLAALPSLMLQTSPHSENGEWLQKWTLTYFTWWIAWAPFVGTFIARISRGRTIRQFVVGVLLAPTLLTIAWFTIFGGTALHEELYGRAGLTEVVSQDITVALFTLLDRLPLPRLLAVVAVVLDFAFLVTSADSATFVLGIFATEGSEEPPRARRLVWGSVIGVLTGALIIAQNLHVMRSMMVLGAIPFVLVMLVQVAAFGRTLPLEKQL